MQESVLKKQPNVAYVLLVYCSSESGYVNIYTWEAVMNGSIRRPKPLKSVGNLTTAVDQLLFHPSNQLLYMSSSLQSAAARLVSQPLFSTPHFQKPSHFTKSQRQLPLSFGRNFSVFSFDGFPKTISFDLDANQSTCTILNYQLGGRLIILLDV